VASHKRASCQNSTAEEKKFFAKRKFVEVVNDDFTSFNSSDVTLPEAPEVTKEKIDDAVANFFFRTGISFRIADSQAFKEMVEAFNPAAATSIPSSKTLSGMLLDRQFTKCSQLLDEILNESEDLTLVSDGWTNIRGDHMVNRSKAVFPTGITQNAQAIADAIIEILEKLGPEKFSCLITDNAPVMRAAWEIIETKYPHISANGCS